MSTLGTIAPVLHHAPRTAGVAGLPSIAASGAIPIQSLARLIPARWRHRPSRRTIRVSMLLLVIAAISLGDLYLTLTFLKSGGMNEGNPIARYIMSFDCQWLLSAWKVLLTMSACGILLGCRKARSAEIAAWFGVAVMVWLAFRWHEYAYFAPDAAASVLRSQFQPHDWVSLTSERAVRQP